MDKRCEIKEAIRGLISPIVFKNILQTGLVSACTAMTSAIAILVFTMLLVLFVMLIA